MTSEEPLRIGVVVDELLQILTTVSEQFDRSGSSTYGSVQAAMRAELSLHLLNYVRFLENEGLLTYDRISDEVRLTEDGRERLRDPQALHDPVRVAFGDHLVESGSEDVAKESFSELFDEVAAEVEQANFKPGEGSRLGDLESPAASDVLDYGSDESVTGFTVGDDDEIQQEEVTFDAGASVSGVGSWSSSTKEGGSMAVEAFERVDEIGSGGIGTVFRGRQVRLNREVAIKEIREIFNVFAGVQREDILERFRSIVKTQASLLHPNIIQLIDVDTSGEYPFSVMQLAPNGNLRRVIEHGERPPLAVSVKYFLQILHGLNTAHDQGVVHGSLKPENIVLDQAGNAMLTDFGISRIVEREGGRGNQVYVGVGSVAYMSPEQFQDPNLATKKSDIYSLGIMFYEMLTGKVPGRRSPMPSSFYPDIPRALDDIFDRMSMDREEDRYDSIDEVIADLYSAEKVLAILDKRSGVLFLRDPISHGVSGLGDEFDALGDEGGASSGALNGSGDEDFDVDDSFSAREDSEPGGLGEDSDSDVEELGDMDSSDVEDDELEEGPELLDKLDKYGELFDED